MKNLIFSLALISVLSCTTGGKKQNEEQADQRVTYSLEEAWASDTLLKTPESVLFDRDRNVLYVSNINLNPWEKDGNGFISKMDLSGNIVELKWIEGLHGPKGMGVYDGTLFIADIDEVVEADVENGEITRRTAVAGDPDLNDITVSEDGTVYVSGSSSNSIYAVKDGVAELFLKGEEERYNGLFWEKERMLLITSGSSEFKAIDWKTKEMTVLAKIIGNGDGIAPVGDGGYLTSSWKGKLFYISPKGEAIKLLDSEAEGIYTADIDYSIKQNLLFVPTFYDNRVIAYKFIQSK